MPTAKVPSKMLLITPSWEVAVFLHTNQRAAKETRNENTFKPWLSSSDDMRMTIRLVKRYVAGQTRIIAVTRISTFTIVFSH